MQFKFLECSTRNVSVLVPRDWRPDVPTVRLLAYISQKVLTTLHLNIGRANILFVEDASAGVDTMVLRTTKSFWDRKALLLVHPRMKSLVVSSKTDDNIAGVVAGGAAITRYNLFHPYATKLKEEEVYKFAYASALNLIHSARAIRSGSE